MKVRAGFYKYTFETTLDGNPAAMKVEIEKSELGGWIQRVRVADKVDEGLNYSTKHHALEAARLAAQKGWKYVQGLGYCVLTS